MKRVKKQFKLVVLLSNVCSALSLAAQSGWIYDYDFNLTENEGEKTASLSWVSTLGAGYVVEESDRLDGQWTIASGGEAMKAEDFLSSANVKITNDVGNARFFRVRQTDIDGPSFSFESPIKDAVAVPLASDVRVRITDDSDIDPESVALWLDDARVPSENLLWDGTDLVYSPLEGTLGTNGQEILVRVVAQDRLGNEAQAFSTIILERPLTVIASSLLCVGDPGLGLQSYSETDSVRTELPSIRLDAIDDVSMTFSGANDGDIQTGQYILSLVPTNIFYRKALLVTPLGSGSYCVATTNAALREIFSGNFSTDYMDCTIYGEDGLPVGEIRNATKSRVTNLRSVHTIEPSIKTINEYYKIGESIGAEYEKDGKAYGFSFNPEISCHLLGKFSVSGQFDPFNADNDDLTLFLQGELTFDYETSMVFSYAIASPYEKKKTIPGAKFAVLLVPPPAPPLWLEFSLDFYGYLKAQADVEGRITAGATVFRSFKFHRRKRGDIWYPGPEDEGLSGYTEEKPRSFDVSGTASVRVGAGVQLTAYFESFIGPFISAGPFVEASISRGVSSGGAYTTRRVIAGGEAMLGIDSRFIKIPSLGALTLSRQFYEVLYEHTDMELPPEISLPETITVAEGQEVILMPQVTLGNAPITYSWEKNSIPIPSYDPSGCLKFVATENTSGRYKVTASNLGGSTSREVLVVVAPQYSLVDFAGKWRQVHKDGGYRQFNIKPDGSGYYQWLGSIQGVYALRYTTEYPLRCTLLEDGKRLSIVRIKAETGEEDRFELRLTGTDKAILTHYNGKLREMKRISTTP